MSGIGHFEHVTAATDRAHDANVDRLSKTALARIFPAKYARPVPREAQVVVDPTPPLKAEIAELKGKNVDLERENARLNVLVAELSKPLSKRRPVTIEAVMEAFCNAMDAAGRTVERTPWDVDALQSACRAAHYARPRQVCMWLVRRICLRTSWPKLSQAFGGRDHTTAIHAYRRAPEIMEVDPGLRMVAVSVLRTFGAENVLESGAAQ